MYNARRTSALAISLVFSVVLYFFLLFANHNPNLSAGTFAGTLTAGWMEFLLSAHFWLLLTALAFFALSYRFAALFGSDLNASQAEVNAFFDRLDRPVDVVKEVIATGAKEANIFPLVGWISVGLAGVTLLILVVPVARTNIGVNLGISGLLLLIGVAMILSKHLTKPFAPTAGGPSREPNSE